MVVIDSSVPGRVARFLPAWRKCMTMTIGPACTIVFVGLSETNTIGYYRPLARPTQVGRPVATAEKKTMTTKANHQRCAVCGGEMHATTITHEEKRDSNIHL